MDMLQCALLALPSMDGLSGNQLRGPSAFLQGQRAVVIAFCIPSSCPASWKSWVTHRLEECECVVLLSGEGGFHPDGWELDRGYSGKMIFTWSLAVQWTILLSDHPQPNSSRCSDVPSLLFLCCAVLPFACLFTRLLEPGIRGF